MTSCKPGNGVHLLRDNNIETYWQSDGAQPHLVNVQFQRKVKLCELALYTDFRKDESYTPSKITIRAGNSVEDLKDIKTIELQEPQGWVVVPLMNMTVVNQRNCNRDKKRKGPKLWDEDEDEEMDHANTAGQSLMPPESNDSRKVSSRQNLLDPIHAAPVHYPVPLRCHMIQLAVIANHQNGRDTHLRQIKIYGPRQYVKRNMTLTYTHIYNAQIHDDNYHLKKEKMD